jgi:hypothetical protein
MYHVGSTSLVSVSSLVSTVLVSLSFFLPFCPVQFCNFACRKRIRVGWDSTITVENSNFMISTSLALRENLLLG